ncbi:hypothetical protein BC829DRAFT_429288 [Chytridium lagenaria]|nr:hypothetical protein BC829DRAFT_429288 [Chytridium lagenaria]
MTATKFLENMFPALGAEKVVALLEECEYDIPLALERIMGEGEETATTVTATTAGKVVATTGSPVNGKKPICRHFMSGSCYRADCWFSHDLDSTVCKFWLRGLCVRGDTCPFSHGSSLTPPSPSPPPHPLHVPPPRLHPQHPPPSRSRG